MFMEDDERQTWGPRAQRTFWTVDRIMSNGMDNRRQVDREEDAILVSSLCKSGDHAPALDFDFPVALLSTGHADSINLVLTNPSGFYDQGPWSTLGRLLEEQGLTSGPIWTSFPSPEAEEKGALECRAMFVWRSPVEVHRSSSKHHYHLYADHEIPWEAYAGMLELMLRCGLLESGFVRNSIHRRQTMLLKPGLRKRDLAARGITIEEYD